MPQTAQSEFVTSDFIAERLHVHRNTIGRWVECGWLPPPIRLGPAGRWLRWRRSVIEEFLRELEAKAVS
jgi:predicted DNA-binding transcriptional regulator AlpA